jgi:hypothetical protein
MLPMPNAGKSSVKLAMSKDRLSQVDNCPVKGQALTAVECSGVGKAQRKLSSKDSPVGALGVEFEFDAREWVGLDINSGRGMA